jgi:hypothetical protein
VGEGQAACRPRRVTLSGHQVILHVQASAVKDLADPKALLEWWDKAMALEDDLIALRRLAPERVVPDRQISAGFMHSGYPFMCWIDPSQKDSVDLAKLTKEGHWGFFHELGHNHQCSAWTFMGQTEVTCNLFSLYVMEKPRRQADRPRPSFDGKAGRTAGQALRDRTEHGPLRTAPRPSSC